MSQRQRLLVRLFGPPEIVLDGNPATGFDSDKVRALLAYLAVENDRPHRRERLAGLLWPDYPERSARTNLRRALTNLRQVIGDRDAEPPFLLITRQTIQFNASSDSWLDVAAFTNLIGGEGAHLEQLEEAVNLYRGSFLEGFSISDSTAYEEWSLLQAQSLLMQVISAYSRLTQELELSSQYGRALSFARRQIELDPYRDEAQRQMMRLLARSGQSSDALTQYQTFRQILADELDTVPAVETTALYERIQRGEFEQDDGRMPMQPVRGYELRDFIGAGHFGAVYRAYQPVIARDVAIKIILPQYANDPAFIRRFEIEAQTVARLEHPYIVPLYDYWREPGEAYLVMRWLRGGNLKKSLARGPWKAEPAVQLLDQIAAALTTAHRQGVIHRDIKPANILLDEEGNAYLSDFGIATMTGPLAAFNDKQPPVRQDGSGSLGYLSPETARGETVSMQSDIYSLGVMLYELLTSQHPFPTVHGPDLIDKHLYELLPNVSVLREDLPPAVDEVILKATAKDPQDRYESALALAVSFRQALIPDFADTADLYFTGEIPNPYKGLRPFQEADAAEFFGREELVARLTAAVAGPAESGDGDFLVLVGPSGSGKSSVAKAGIIPALRQGAIPSSEDWFIVTLTPGTHPMEELEAALLRIAVNPPESLLGQLREDERGLLRAVKRVLPGDECKLLLVIDQFEELFTLVKSAEERGDFLRSLSCALGEPGCPLKVIITLRADFYDRPLQYSGFGVLVQANTEAILPLSAEELERAIAGPAEQVGINLETGLVAEMITGVIDQPGALPLLQFALTELFDNRQDNVMTLEAYRSGGGVDGALSQRAETLYAAFDAGEQTITRQLFMRLVTLGEGVEDTRRRVLRSELMAIHPIAIGDDSAVEDSKFVSDDIVSKILETFGSARILTFDREPETREPTVEIAHEALLSAWERLRGWLRDGRDDIRLQRRLAGATKEWEDAGGGSSYLLRGARLALFEEWAANSDVALTIVEENYLSSSVTAREERNAAEEKRRREELETAQQLVETRTKANRRLRWLALGLALILLLAFGAALMAWQQSQRSAQQARLATARELTAAALRNLDEDPERSILLALEAAAIMQETGQQVLLQTEEALHLGIQADRLQYTVPGQGAVAYSPDGKILATSGTNGINISDMTTGQSSQYRATIVAEPNNLVFSDDGRYLAATLPNGTAVLWGATKVEELITFTAEGLTLVSPALSPDGSLLASSTEEGPVIVWNTSSGEKVAELAHEAMTTGIAFSPDGLSLAVGSFDWNAHVWDTSNWEKLLTISGHGMDVNDVIYSPDNLRLATVSTDGTARVWDTTTGEEVSSMLHGAWVYGVDISPDGTRLATGGTDGRAIVWDMETGRQLVVLAGHTSYIGNVAFSPDGKHLATAGPGSTAPNNEPAANTKVWDISAAGSRDLSTLEGHDEIAFVVAYSPDGKQLASGSWDGTIKLWDVSTQEELLTLEGHNDWLARIAYTPDGSRLASASYDGTVKMWDVSSGETVYTIEPDIGSVWGLAVSPDGKQLATGGEDGSLIIWDVASGEELDRFAGHPAPIWRLNYSPDGTQLVSAGWDSTAKLWDSSTGQELLTLTGHENEVNQAVFSQDGTKIATASMDGTIKLWDAQSGRLMKTFVGHTDAVWDVEFSLDGSRLASGGFDGSPRVWDVESGETLFTLPTEGSVQDLTFSPDGKLLTMGVEDGTIRTFILPIEELIALARTRVTRSLTNHECRQYLHLEQCPDVDPFSDRPGS